MKEKKTILIIILILLILPIIAVLCFCQFTKVGYLLSMPYRPEFQTIEPNVYLNTGNSLSPEEVKDITAQAKARVTAFFGELRCIDTTVLIICDDINISNENWVIKTNNGRNVTPLEDMDTIREFQCSNEEERQFHYLCAKQEIKEWLDNHSMQELIELVERINAGEDFHALYSMPSAG